MFPGCLDEVQCSQVHDIGAHSYFGFGIVKCVMLSNVLNSISAIATCYIVVEVSVLKGSTFVTTRCISAMILIVVIRNLSIIRGGFGFFLILLF